MLETFILWTFTIAMLVFVVGAAVIVGSLAIFVIKELFF